MAWSYFLNNPASKNDALTLSEVAERLHLWETQVLDATRGAEANVYSLSLGSGVVNVWKVPRGDTPQQYSFDSVRSNDRFWVCDQCGFENHDVGYCIGCGRERVFMGKCSYVNDYDDWTKEYDGSWLYEGYDFNIRIFPSRGGYKVDLYFSQYGDHYEYDSVYTQGASDIDEAFHVAEDLVDSLYEKGLIKGGSLVEWDWHPDDAFSGEQTHWEGGFAYVIAPPAFTGGGYDVQIFDTEDPDFEYGEYVDIIGPFGSESEAKDAAEKYFETHGTRRGMSKAQRNASIVDGGEWSSYPKGNTTYGFSPGYEFRWDDGYISFEDVPNGWAYYIHDDSHGDFPSEHEYVFLEAAIGAAEFAIKKYFGVDFRFPQLPSEDFDDAKEYVGGSVSRYAKRSRKARNVRKAYPLDYELSVGDRFICDAGPDGKYQVTIIGLDADWVDIATDEQIASGMGGLSMPRQMFEFDVRDGEYTKVARRSKKSRAMRPNKRTASKKMAETKTLVDEYGDAVTYYQYEDLDYSAQQAAYDEWYRNADADMWTEGNLDSAKTFFDSINAGKIDWSIDGFAGPSWMNATMDSGFQNDLAYYGFDLANDIPEGQDDGYHISIGLKEEWQTNYRPQILSLAQEIDSLENGVDTADDDVQEDLRQELVEAYENALDELSDLAAKWIEEDRVYFVSEEYFIEECNVNDWYFEEDGTFVGEVNGINQPSLFAKMAKKVKRAEYMRGIEEIAGDMCREEIEAIGEVPADVYEIYKDCVDRAIRMWWTMLDDGAEVPTFIFDATVNHIDKRNWFEYFCQTMDINAYKYSNKYNKTPKQVKRASTYELWETYYGEKSLIGTYDNESDANANKEWFEKNSDGSAVYEVVKVGGKMSKRLKTSVFSKLTKAAKRIMASAIDSSEVEDFLNSEGPFDDAYEAVLDYIDDHLIYYDDQWDVIMQYANPSDIFEWSALYGNDIWSDFVNDIISELPYDIEYWNEENFGKDASRRIRKARRVKKASEPALYEWEENGDGTYTLYDMMGHEFMAYEPYAINDPNITRWTLDVSWGNDDLSDWGNDDLSDWGGDGYPHTIGEFDTAEELDEYVTREWYNQDKWAKKAGRTRKASYDSSFDQDIMDFIEDKLYAYEGEFYYGSELAAELTHDENMDGGWIPGTQAAWDYIAEHRQVASDVFDYCRDNFGESPNPLENPPAFTFYMLDYGVSNVLANCPTVYNQDDEIELTGEVINQILSECDKTKAAYRKKSRRGRRSFASRRKVALRAKVAMYADEVSYDIEGYLNLDGPFDDEDEVREYIDSCIDSALIYTDDIWNMISDYCDAQEILNQNENILTEFIDDVYDNIGDLSKWVKEEDDDDEDW